jgi:hypothetical protein
MYTTPFASERMTKIGCAEPGANWRCRRPRQNPFLLFYGYESGGLDVYHCLGEKGKGTLRPGAGRKAVYSAGRAASRGIENARLFEQLKCRAENFEREVADCRRAAETASVRSAGYFDRTIAKLIGSPPGYLVALRCVPGSMCLNG